MGSLNERWKRSRVCPETMPSAQGQAGADLGATSSHSRQCSTSRPAFTHARNDGCTSPQRALRTPLVILRRREHVVAHRNRLPPAVAAVRKDRKEPRQGSLARRLSRRPSAMEAGVPGPASYPANYRNRVLKPLAEALNIPKLTFQVLRRTMATRAQALGSVKDIQAHLRHSRADTTANEYMQELPESVQQMVGTGLCLAHRNNSGAAGVT